VVQDLASAWALYRGDFATMEPKGLL
jgi:hypothetical protein